MIALSAEAPGERRSAFAEPRFARYFPSSLFSTLGSWIVRFLVGYSAWALTGSAFWVGVVAGLMLAPTFLLSPLFGILAERINPRNGIMATLAVHALIALAAGAAEALGLLTLPALLVLATTLGAATAAHTPIRLALVPRLVGRNALPSAIGISAMTFNTARILGPAAGAWLIAHFSVAAAYMVAGLLFAGALPVLAALRDVAAPPPRAGGSFARQLREGVAYARNSPGMRLIFAFGLAFELPVVLLLMVRAGLVSPEGLAEKRKIAIVIAFVAAAILTPPDVVSQLLLALPIIALYEISIIGARIVAPKDLNEAAD